MIEEIKAYCRETNQKFPETVGEVAFCVFNSLSASYKESIGELEEIFEKQYKRINVFGGGCQNELLNELLAKVTKKEVLAGPVEATAIGNIVAQLLSYKKVADLEEARTLIEKSFEIKTYMP
jgi:rhamnulokinase